MKRTRVLFPEEARAMVRVFATVEGEEYLPEDTDEPEVASAIQAWEVRAPGGKVLARHKDRQKAEADALRRNSPWALG